MIEFVVGKVKIIVGKGKVFRVWIQKYLILSLELSPIWEVLCNMTGTRDTF